MDEAKGFIKATGAYEIIYASGYKYVGKGGFYRATTSALKHAAENGDSVVSLSWKSSTNKQWAYVDEYVRQIATGFQNGGKLYNKIWSPGRRIVNELN